MHPGADILFKSECVSTLSCGLDQDKIAKQFADDVCSYRNSKSINI